MRLPRPPGHASGEPSVLSPGVAGYQNRLGAGEKQLGAVENRLGMVESRLGVVENRLDSPAADLNSLQAEVAARLSASTWGIRIDAVLKVAILRVTLRH
jgi:hypothetical protein